MHRLVMGLEDGHLYIDHINHNPHDNRKDNLRIVTHNQNMFNKEIYKNNTSGHKGVYWHKRDEKWVARIQVDKKQVELGRFTNLNEAIETRKKAEILYYGEYRNKLN